MTYTDFIKDNPIVETISTDKKTYRDWVKTHELAKESAKENKESLNDFIKGIAKTLKRDPDAYLSTWKSSVSRAKLVLGITVKKASSSRSEAVVINVASICDFVSKASLEDVTAIETAVTKALANYKARQKDALKHKAA